MFNIVHYGLSKIVIFTWSPFLSQSKEFVAQGTLRLFKILQNRHETVATSLNTIRIIKLSHFQLLRALRFFHGVVLKYSISYSSMCASDRIDSGSNHYCCQLLQAWLFLMLWILFNAAVV